MTAREDLQRFFHDLDDCSILRRDGKKTILKYYDPKTGLGLFVKIYHNTCRPRIFPFLAARSAGERHFRINHRLAAEGICVPVPFGSAVKRNGWGVIKQSLSASHWVSDMTPLIAYTSVREGRPAVSALVLRSLNRSLGGFIADLHRRGVQPYDVNSGNFLVRAVDPGEFRIMLVDLEDITFRRSIRRNQRIRNLSQIAACMLSMSTTATEDVCEGYLSALGIRSDKALAAEVQDRAIAVRRSWNERLNASFTQIAIARSGSAAPQETHPNPGSHQ